MLTLAICAGIMLAAVAAHSRLGKAKVGFQPNRS